jgi:hypothetical protein
MLARVVSLSMVRFAAACGTPGAIWRDGGHILEAEVTIE